MLARPSRFLPNTVVPAAVLALLASCGGQRDRGPAQVDVIGRSDELAEPLRNAARASGQLMLGATAQGLVAFNANGEVVSGLAERWIVEDDGQSYIFRLKPAQWTDGAPVKAEEVAKLLAARMAATPTILAGLKPDVRGMTDLVVEIRLPGPMPSFLQLLAQPEMAIARPSGGTGPWRKTLRKDVATLEPIKSVDADVDAPTIRSAAPPRIYVRAVRAAVGFARFQQGYIDLLMGGRFQHLPYTAIANLPNGAVRADPVNGLFGLIVEGDTPFLSDRNTREILSMAINRDHIASVLNVAAWPTTTTILPDTLDLGRPPADAPWADQSPEQRQSYARSVVTNWRSLHGAAPPLRIALPPGPGAAILFHSLARDYNAIGLSVVRVSWESAADLRLIDEVAPFDSALWYLARLGCGLNRLCSTEATAALKTATEAQDDDARAKALSDAETLTLAENNYIPIGMPIRFALVQRRLTGYQPSPRARHPLNALYQVPR